MQCLYILLTPESVQLDFFPPYLYSTVPWRRTKLVLIFVIDTETKNQLHLSPLKNSLSKIKKKEITEKKKQDNKFGLQSSFSGSVFADHYVIVLLKKNSAKTCLYVNIHMIMCI